MLNSIDIGRGGLTKACLTQASAFADSGYDTEILTFNYNPRFPLICRTLIQEKKVSKKVSIRNMFEDRADYTQKDVPAIEACKVDLKTFETDYAISKREDTDAYRLYKNGIYNKYISLREDGTLDFIDYFNENRYRTRRESYNYHNDLSRVQYFSFENNKIKQTVYYDRHQKAILSRWNHPVTGKNQRVISFSSENQIRTETTGDETIHKIDWLETVIGKSRKTVIISDTRSTDPVLVGLENDAVKKVLRLHSNHLKNPDDKLSEMTRGNGYLINNISNVDAIAVLTEKQKQDITDRFGHERKVFAIPNFTQVQVPKVTGIRSLIDNVRYIKNYRSTRDMKKAVIISRFSKLKNIDHGIKAFEKVLERVPEAKLEIWGQGDYAAEYEKLISELGLSKSVKVKGYTTNADRKYQSAALSLMTSKSEGFSLSVMESMFNGTPVISYDIHYGPSEMIIEGENGFLVKKGDIDALAEKIIYLMENSEVARDMGEKAKQHMNQSFNRKKYKNKWFSLVDHLLENEESRGAEE